MIKTIIIGIVLIFVAFYALSFDYSSADKFAYGVSFSRFHSDELGLDWKETYLAILNDLKVRNFRFSAHWPLTEPKEGEYNFRELDFQMNEAQKAGASVIMAVGRRLPGWPECHEPEWAKDLEKTKKQDKLLEYIETVVDRYKNYPNILYWQVENEPHLTFFSKQACGEFEDAFFQRELDLVKKLDPKRPTLITDSGEFGTWYKTYRHGDVFGTSIYLYIWWRNFIGPLRYPITPAFFRIKHNLVKLIYGNKPAIVIELSSEPWLLEPILETPVDTQLDRMGIDKFNEMISFSSQTSFYTFYFWGAEWWYWMKEKQNHPEFWNRANEIF